MNTTNIHSRALLVCLTISAWSARKYDKRVTNQVNIMHNASSDAGRWNKMLLPGDAASYKALMAMLGSIRTWHYAETLAWSDEGWRLLPTANYTNYTDTLRQKQNELYYALEAFISDYPTLKANARIHLNGNYNEADYPAPDDVRKRFSVGVGYNPVPVNGDIRVSLASDQIADIEESIATRVQAATQLAMQDAWTRLYDVVSHIRERLSDSTAIFRDSLISNAKETCDALKRLNVTDDPELERMRVQVIKDLTQHTPDTLRESVYTRQDTANKANAILDQMKGIYGVSC